MNLSSFYPKRDDWAHKGSSGYVLMVSGSNRYTGSPIFLSIAALRSGADIVTAVGPERAMNVAANFLPDIITIPLSEELNKKHVPEILSLAEHFDSLVIGPGLDRSKETYKATIDIIKGVDIPMVIDAEAIRALRKNFNVLRDKSVVLTPHTGEFEDLTGEVLSSDVKTRKELAEKWARKLGAVILLKGHVDVVSDGVETLLNKTGSSYMTKGGFGDTLSGICGAMLARGQTPIDSALAAAYINGKAGELASKEFGESVIASDIFEFIPDVIG